MFDISGSRHAELSTVGRSKHTEGELRMDEYESLNHTKWECKYHVVFIPKCRRKALFGELRRQLGDVFKRLAEQKECRIEEGHMLLDHVHMMISIPPKYSVAQIVGYIKGQERDPHRARLRGAAAELRWAALLGARLLRVDRGPRRGGDPRVHPSAGGRGQAHGSDEALVGHLQVAHRRRSRAAHIRPL